MIMGLRRPIIDHRTADQILQDMTPEERTEFEKECQNQIVTPEEHAQLIETLKTRPASINFDTYEDMGKFIKDVRASKYD